MKWYLFLIYLLDDYWLIFRNHFQYFFHKRPPKHWGVADKGDVILIPGASAHWISLKKIAKTVHKLGYRVHFVEELGANVKPIPEAAADVASYINSNNLKQVILIGHSKGGVIAVYLLKDPIVAEKIKRVINIAGPLKGIPLSRFYSAARDLDLSSDLIKNLKDGIDTHKIINLYPTIDDFVIPNENLVWKNCKNIQIKIFGHMRIVEAKETINKIKSILNS